MLRRTCATAKINNNRISAFGLLFFATPNPVIAGRQGFCLSYQYRNRAGQDNNNSQNNIKTKRKSLNK